MKGISPTQNSLKYLRENGYTPWIVERFISFTNKRIDMFGIADLIAIKDGEILAVQTTSYKAASPHRKLLRESPMTELWRNAGGKIELHLWLKEKNKWVVRIEEY